MLFYNTELAVLDTCYLKIVFIGFQKAHDYIEKPTFDFTSTLMADNFSPYDYSTLKADIHNLRQFIDMFYLRFFSSY